MRVAHGEVKRRVLRACVRLRVCCDAFAGFQLGAPSKAYNRNFAEAMHATHSKVRILVRPRARARFAVCCRRTRVFHNNRKHCHSHTRSLPPSPCNRTACVLSTCKCNISKRVTSASSYYSNTSTLHRSMFVCRCVKSLLYGGDNVTVPDPNPEKSANFRKKLGKVRASACNTSLAHIKHCIAHLHFIPFHPL